MKNEKKGKTAIAALIINSWNEVLLVSRGDDWSIPAGNMKEVDNFDPRKTLRREMKEELPGMKSLRVIDVLDSFVRNKSSPKRKAKFIWVFSCFLRKGKIIRYNEGETVFWIRRSQALELPNLDELAYQAIKDDLERRPEPDRGKGVLSDGKQSLKGKFSKSENCPEEQPSIR